jgi:hypothetical protein
VDLGRVGEKREEGHHKGSREIADLQAVNREDGLSGMSQSSMYVRELPRYLRIILRCRSRLRRCI